jgi:orotate phosphoribosyltransferase
MNQSQEIAKLLLEIKAITLNLREPYRYTSGILSPIYCDNRLIISYPEKRQIIINAFLSVIKKNNLACDVVAGTATAGIPHAAWIADRLNLPMVYVRSEAKKHGKQNQVEGLLKKNQRALVVEDLISTGGSSIAAGLALRAAQATVTDCIAIFNYQLATAQKKFADANITLHTLSDFNTLIDVATTAGYITAEEKSQALLWNQDPTNWAKNTGRE